METLEKNRLITQYDEELLSVATVSLYDDITETASHSAGYRTDSKQGYELQMNRSSGSAYVCTYIVCQVSFVLTEPIHNRCCNIVRISRTCIAVTLPIILF